MQGQREGTGLRETNTALCSALRRPGLHLPGRGGMSAERHMRRAIALACESVAAGGGPFGAVIARGDEVGRWATTASP
jgi:hypothetical protein